mmetsp:Transcript_28489/g.42318  ORF Transcript_28489/g.42318 Transcript_28489/m.42318 type:complete len:133 (-) Transcript_28489:60-458(-)
MSKKGPVFTTAIIAGTMAAKNTWNLIPFCHPLPLESCKININLDKLVPEEVKKSANPTCLLTHKVTVDCKVKTSNKTGVEMEALAGCSVAALCIYDMLKALSHEIIISDTYLVKKTGGKSDFGRQEGAVRAD